MPMAPRRRWTAALLATACLAVLGTAGCGGDDEAAAEPIDQLPADLLPTQLLDLAVAQEDVADRLDIKTGGQAYVGAVGLYSFRRDELLQATLQVSRFSDEAREDDAEFRRGVASQVAGSGVEVQQFRMEDHSVFFAVGLQQSVAVWFRGDHFFVLSTRDDYEQPRALLRTLLDLEVKL